MEQSVKEMNLLQKLARVRKNVEVLQKNKAGYGYKYVTEDLILEKITGLMDRLDISLVPRIVPGTTQVIPYQYTKTKSTKDGRVYEEKVNETIVQAELTWTWYDNANPDDNIVVPWVLVGQQTDVSQSFGSGLSYSSRYFLLKYFNVATTDEDPDNWRSRQKEAEEAEQRQVAQEIVARIREKVGAVISGGKGTEEDVKTLIRQFVFEKGKPSVNYLSIKDPLVASKLLEALNDKYPENKE